MTILVCVLVNSYWSSGDMKPTSRPMSLLTHDLEVRSSGSPGRDLMERLDTYCLELLGTSGPLQFAKALQIPEPENRRALEELLEWTPLDNEFLLIALVALTPNLEGVALRLSWGQPSNDTVAEVLLQATDALHWTNELVEGERADFVLMHALAKTRNEQRRVTRHNVTTTFIPDDFDTSEPKTERSVTAFDIHTRAIAKRVISKADSLLIQITRGEEIPLQVLADELGMSYDALRMRRTRAEDALRHYARSKGLRR